MPIIETPATQRQTLATLPHLGALIRRFQGLGPCAYVCFVWYGAKTYNDAHAMYGLSGVLGAVGIHICINAFCT